MSRILKNKFLNCLMKNGNKFCTEKLFKKILKNFNKNNKKRVGNILYLIINYTLPTFEIGTRKVKKKKLKLIKFKPFFLFKNKNRIFIALKLILKNSNLQKNSFLINFKNEILLPIFNNTKLISKKNDNQKQALVYENILTFYRWD